ncbi:hypothetical protein [Rhizobium sp.]|uniref:hypothetical protein n=1 Tax=Rhizobium sp. TaxID=391 RepID=UPI002F109359
MYIPTFLELRTLFFQGYFSSADDLDVQVNVASYLMRRRFQAPLTNRHWRRGRFYPGEFCEISLIKPPRLIWLARFSDWRLAASGLVCDLKEPL